MKAVAVRAAFLSQLALLGPHWLGIWLWSDYSR